MRKILAIAALLMLAAGPAFSQASITGKWPARLKPDSKILESELAQRQGLSGTVIMRVMLYPDGTNSAELLQSSGHDLLDAAAYQSVWSWSFLPAPELKTKENIDIPIHYARAPNVTPRKIIWPAKFGLPDGALAPKWLGPLPTTKGAKNPFEDTDPYYGTVGCEVLIGADGSVQDARMLSWDKKYYQTSNALLFIETRRFEPARVNGKPVPVRVVIKMAEGNNRRPWIGVQLTPPKAPPPPLPEGAPGPQKTLMDEAYRTGLLHLQRNEYDAAIADYGTAIQRQPENIQAFADRASAYAHRGAPGDVERALADVSHIVTVSPDNAAVYLARADAYMFLKMPDKALEDVDRAIFINPGWAQYYAFRSGVNHARGDDAAATADARNAQLVDPDFGAKYVTRGNEDHVWQNALLVPNGMARLDPLWETPRVSTRLIQKWSLSGRVTLMVRVNGDGKPESIKIKTPGPSPLLDAAAILSVANWGYLPTTKDGVSEDSATDWVEANVDYPPLPDTPALQPPAWPSAGLPNGTVPARRIPDVGDEMWKLYPPIAMRLKQEGTVDLDLLVGADGTVQNVMVRRTSTFALLDAAAFRMVENWRYTPAQLNGTAIAARVPVTIVWKLPPPGAQN